jgi:5'-methylthioinosine phosphorylase
MSLKIAVIGGTGAMAATPSDGVSSSGIETPYGDPSSPILTWRSSRDGGDTEFSFLARHGLDADIPPHRVNYRANVWAVAQIRPDHVIAINAVGGIAAGAPPGMLVFPDQIIDYTWGREHTFADGSGGPVNHVDFTEPFSAGWREQLIATARKIGLDCRDSGTYAATQGPRLETAAEIDRLERDGCDVVGMTGMPEAALARELELDYAICAVVINQAAGRGGSGIAIHDEIERYVAAGMDRVRQLLDAL